MKSHFFNLSLRFAVVCLLASALPALAQLPTSFVTRNVTNSGLGSNNVRGVYASGGTIYAATWGPGGLGYLSISANGGGTWTNYNSANGTGSDTFNGVYASGGTIYAATGGGLSISTNGGTSFVNYNSLSGLGSSAVQGVYASGGTIYAATGGGLSISTNGGASFVTRNFTNSGLANNDLRGVYESGGTIYAATAGGLSISTNGGTSWTNYYASNGLANSYINGVYESGGTIYAATGVGLSISTNGGTNWTNYTTANGLVSSAVVGVYASGGTIYAATGGGLSISSNGGTNWTNYTTANGLGSNIVRGVYESGGTIYAATIGGLSIGLTSPTTPTLYWLGSNGTLWSAGNNWSSNSTGTPTADFASGADIIFSATGSTNSTDTDLGGDLSIGSLIIDTTDPVGISGGNLTVSGATTINNGTLTIGNGGTTGALIGDITNNATLAFNHSNNSTFSGNITGTGSLTKNGTGTTTLTGNNTYTGGTSVNAGTLAGTTSSLQGAIANNSTVNFDQSANGTYAGVMSGSGSLLKTGSGTVTLTDNNTYTGGTTVNAGTLEVATSGSINNAADIFVGILSGDNGTLNITGGSVSNARGYLGSNAGSVGNAIVSAGNWMNSADLFVGLQGTGSLTINGTGSVTNSDGYIGHISGSNGTVSVSGGTWTNRFLLIGNEGTGSLTINGTGNVTNSDGYIGNLPGGNGTVNVSGGTWTNSSNLAVGVSGTGSLTINGTGTVIVGDTLSRGSNGTINLKNGGTLQIGAGGASGTLATDLTNNGTLLFDRSSDSTYSNQISGTGVVIKNGNGTLILTGTSTYTGSTSVNAGTLEVNSSLANTAATVNSGATLAGSGTLGDVTINSGGTIAPGNSPGTISVGDMTWNAGGNYNWQLANATAGAGSGWDLISGGNLAISANATNKFNLNLWTLSATGPDVNGLATNFDPATSYAWNIASFANISGFDASYFNIVKTASNGTAGFVGNEGRFALSQTGNTTLTLTYTAISGAVWNTGTGNWTTASQWKNDDQPTETMPIFFTGNGGTSSNNSFLSSIKSLNFSANATGSYTVDGSAVTISNGITNNSSYDQTVAMDLTLGANQTFDAATGNLAISGNVATAGYGLTADGSYDSAISGAISGTGSLTKNGTGTLTLSGANTYTGGTVVKNGTLEVATGGSLAGGFSGNIQIGEASGENGTLNLTGGSIDHSSNRDYIGSATFGMTGIGTANVSAGTWRNGYVSIGDTGSGTLNLSGTGNMTTLYEASLAGSTGGVGIANVSGGSWTMSRLYMGYWGAGHGTLNLSGVGNVTTVFSAYLGGFAGGVGIANVSGGTWAINRDLSVGNSGGGTSILNLSGSGVVTNKEGYLGGYDHGEGYSAGDGVANISGGTWTNSGNLTVGLVGNGTLNLTENGTVAVGGMLRLASRANSTGTLNLGNGTTAGTLSAARINGGNGTGVVNINQNASYTLGSNMTGSLALNHIGTGTTTLTGNNTYTGATAINAGKLLVNGSLASSTTTVNNGGTLGGSGTLGNVTINSGGTIAPGNSPGTISVGNLTWNAGGNYNWQLADATGTAGTGWDLISGGNLTITANATNKFTINLWSLSSTGPDVSGIAANFDALSNYSWNIGTFSKITGFDASYFDIFTTASNGTDGFAGSNGTFSVNATTTTLLLNYAAGSTPTPTSRAIWNTSSGNWSQPSQWENSLPPLTNDIVSFTGNGGTSINNNYIGALGGISFSSNATGSYTLNGTSITLGSAGIVNNSTFDQTLAISLTLGANQSFTAATGNLSFTGDVMTDGFTLTSDGNRTTSFMGVISGNGSFTKGGGGTTILTGNNTYTGTTTIQSGTLQVGNGGTSGTLGTGAWITNGNLAFNRSDALTLNNTFSGTGSVTKLGSNTLTLTGDNTHSGGTIVNSGILSVAKYNALGKGDLTLNNGSLYLYSAQEMEGNVQIGGNFLWNNGTISYFDRVESPEGQDLKVVVAGNFTNGGGGGTFDFSQVEALDAGVYTLVSFNGTTDFSQSQFKASAGPGTTLQGTFEVAPGGIIYKVTGATSGGGENIQNNGGPNTPVVANYIVDRPTITVNPINTVETLTFNSGGSLNIESNGVLNVTSGTLNVQNGSSVVAGGTLRMPSGFTKMGMGELVFDNNVIVLSGANTYSAGATVTAGSLVVNGMLSVAGNSPTGDVIVSSGAMLMGRGIIAGNVFMSGRLAPGNSPGTLSIAGNLNLDSGSTTLIEIESPTNFDRIVVTGTATLGGTLNAVAYGGGTITPGARYDILQAGSIVGAFDSLIAPDGLRLRFLNSDTVGTLLFSADSYVPMAINPNQVSVAKALDTFIAATDGDRLTVSIALDSLTTEQFPAAFDQIMPGFYESLANIVIEQAFAQTQMLNQRISSVRLGAAGFQAIGGISQPLLHDKNGKSAADAKDASPIVESATATNWNAWALGTGMFSRSTNLGSLQNYNNDAGGFLVGADYRWSENFVTGLYGGYDYSYAEYNGGGSTKGNSFSFGTYASYAKGGYYADAVIGGGYTGFQTQRSIEFSTIDRTASADSNSGQFTAGINLGKDFEVGQFTLGPIVGAQYTYAGIGSFTESGAESLDLSLGQQNANSLRSTLGGRIAYTWNLNQKIALIPEVRMFWQHEFLNNARNINSSLDGGNGASFDFETTDPYRNSVFAGAGVTAQFGKNLTGSVFYNINFGSETYQNNMVSAGLTLSF